MATVVLIARSVWHWPPVALFGRRARRLTRAPLRGRHLNCRRNASMRARLSVRACARASPRDRRTNLPANLPASLPAARATAANIALRCATRLVSCSAESAAGANWPPPPPPLAELEGRSERHRCNR